MATVEKRTSQDGKISYRAKIRLKGYPMQSATFERRTDCLRWVQNTESAIREGRHFKMNEAKKRTLKDLIDRYAKEILPHKPKSIIAQQAQLNWWKKQIGDYSLADITPALLIEYRSKLLEEPLKRNIKRTSSTANRYFAALSHTFTMAIKEWGWLQDNPILKVTKLKEPRGRTRYLSDDERDRLLKGCKASQSPYLYILVALALSTGARKMEIVGLKWQDVDLERSLIFLHDTKNGDKRSLPLVSVAKELMKQHYQQRNDKTDLVFPSKNLRKPIDIRTPFKTVIKKCEIKDFRWHDLRHSAASYLAMNGASAPEIAAVLGHKTLSMVKRYAHLSDSHTAGVLESMNNKMFNRTKQ